MKANTFRQTVANEWEVSGIEPETPSVRIRKRKVDRHIVANDMSPGVEFLAASGASRHDSGRLNMAMESGETPHG